MKILKSYLQLEKSNIDLMDLNNKIFEDGNLLGMLYALVLDKIKPEQVFEQLYIDIEDYINTGDKNQISYIIEIFKLLSKKGININQKKKDYTIMSILPYYCQIEIIEVFFELGATANSEFWKEYDTCENKDKIDNLPLTKKSYEKYKLKSKYNI